MSWANVADVVALAVAKAVALGLRPPLHPPPLLPPLPPAPPIVKRERQPDADDDDAKTKQRGRRYRAIYSTVSSSSASGGQAPLLSIDDMYCTVHDPSLAVGPRSDQDAEAVVSCLSLGEGRTDFQVAEE